MAHFFSGLYLPRSEFKTAPSDPRPKPGVVGLAGGGLLPYLPVLLRRPVSPRTAGTLNASREVSRINKNLGIIRLKSYPSPSAPKMTRRRKAAAASPSATPGRDEEALDSSPLDAQMGNMTLRESGAPQTASFPAAAGMGGGESGCGGKGGKGKGKMGAGGNGGGAGPSSSLPSSVSASASASALVPAGPSQDPAPPSQPPAVKKDKTCACCLVVGKWLDCAKCHLVSYCSRECQASARVGGEDRLRLHAPIPPLLFLSDLPPPFLTLQKTAHWRAAHKAVCSSRRGKNGLLLRIYLLAIRRLQIARAGWRPSTPPTLLSMQVGM